MNTTYIWTALRRYRTVLMIGILLSVDLALAVLYGLDRSVDIPTFHLDGAYQTASGLYRLADGQWPGMQFYPYLGVGLLYFLYPIFLLAGGHVAASIFTTHFTIALAGTFSIGLIGAFFSKSHRLLVGVVLGSLVLSMVVWPLPYIPAELTTHFTPGNSLRPLRGFLPYLCAAIVYALLRSRLSPVAIYGGIGAVAGGAFLWSNDSGIPTSGLLVCFALAWAYRTGNLSLKTSRALFGSAWLAALLGLLLATMGHGIDLLRYNFVDVAHDQYWYFAFWNPGSRILSVSDFFTKFVALQISWWGLVLVGMSALTLFRPTLEHALLLFIGLALVGSSAVASVGGHLYSGYMETFIFWCKTTLIIGSAFFIVSASGVTRWRVPWPNGITAGAILVAVALPLWLVAINTNAYVTKLTQKRSDPSRFYVPEMGGYLPYEWKAHVDLARDSKEASVAEEYWVIWSSISQKRVSVPVDSIIHALGETRWLYSRILQKLPDIIVTSTPEISAEWHGWNLSANWWFYRIVLANYQPSKTSPSTYVWKKTHNPSEWPATGCRIDNSDRRQPKIVVDTDAAGYYEVTLQYNANALNSRSLLFVNNNLNYAYIDGYLSIDPRTPLVTFPAVLNGPGTQYLDFRMTAAASDDLLKVSVHSCQVRKIIFDSGPIAVLPALVLPPVLVFPSDDTPFNLTDRNWINGVARDWAGFFVPNNFQNAREFTAGKSIRFSDGQVRTITRQEDGGPYLNIFLSGPPLDGNIVGFPKKFEIQK